MSCHQDSFGSVDIWVLLLQEGCQRTKCPTWILNCTNCGSKRGIGIWATSLHTPSMWRLLRLVLHHASDRRTHQRLWWQNFCFDSIRLVMIWYDMIYYDMNLYLLLYQLYHIVLFCLIFVQMLYSMFVFVRPYVFAAIHIFKIICFPWPFTSTLRQQDRLERTDMILYDMIAHCWFSFSVLLQYYQVSSAIKWHC